MLFVCIYEVPFSAGCGVNAWSMFTASGNILQYISDIQK